MLPFKSILNLDKASKTPLFLQIANGLMDNIKAGLIPKGTKLLGTRAMAETLGVHRKTVIAAYDELSAQGWIETQATKGTFVCLKIPEIKPISLKKTLFSMKFSEGVSLGKITTGFHLTKNNALDKPFLHGSTMLGFDDGFPDVRLAPTDALASAYRSVLKKGYQKNTLFYGDTKGHLSLREATRDYLQESRGLNISVDNVMITRGSIMAGYLSAQTILKAGDRVVVAKIGYGSGNMIFKNRGVEMFYVDVDENGINVEQIAQLCGEKPIRMVYVTPHHHYPTTVTMSAERRMHLLQLAQEHQFCILEDDYDYDFHYSSSPILPLASVDTEGVVVYIGSLCKTISPAIRIGYVVAPTELIDEMAKLRRIIDRQGDNPLEAAIAELFYDGEIKRHLKKSQRTYHKRRDVFCEILKSELGHALDFKKPNGGMAVWAKFDPSINLPILSEKAFLNGLKINSGINYDTDFKQLNSTRMGFTSINESEIEQSIALLKRLI
jgi:GntR family transcriptional regulator / MocR family aminotransferase